MEYQGQVFSQFHCLMEDGASSKTADYLQSLSSLSRWAVLDIFQKMRRCTDGYGWYQKIVPIVMVKYSSDTGLINSALREANEMVDQENKVKHLDKYDSVESVMAN